MGLLNEKVTNVFNERFLFAIFGPPPQQQQKSILEYGQKENRNSAKLLQTCTGACTFVLRSSSYSKVKPDIRSWVFSFNSSLSRRKCFIICCSQIKRPLACRALSMRQRSLLFVPCVILTIKTESTECRFALSLVSLHFHTYLTELSLLAGEQVEKMAKTFLTFI